MAFTKTAGVNYGTPAIVLSTTAASGTNQQAIRTDGQIIAFSTDVPETIAYGQSAATGTDPFASRLDHDHGMAAADNVSAASEAEMVAATSITVFASPGRTQYHPGVAKGWANVASDGSSYETYSMSTGKDATGIYAITNDESFSNITYARLVSMQEAVSYTSTTSDVSVGSYKVRGFNASTGAAVNIDFCTSTFGEQA